MVTGARRLLITAEAAQLRRRLGPTAWAGFEDLLLTSASVADRHVSTASIRSLSERSGLARNTVARALRRLRCERLVTQQQSRADGTFAAGTYEVTIPDGITVDDVRIHDLSAPATTERATPPAHDQLTLSIEA